MLDSSLGTLLILAVFTVGYFAIIFESAVKINKTACALIMAVVTWMFLFLIKGHLPEVDLKVLGKELNKVSQIIFFLLGAMTLVELIDCHRAFRVITNLIRTGSKKNMLWILGATTFFLSAVLDNLTTTIVMISLIRKLIPDPKDRLILGGMVVIAANAGGAWSPIGDVTTTMLWIQGHITTWNTVRDLIFPSLVSLIASLLLFGRNMKGRYPQLVQRAHEEAAEPGARLVFYSGIGALLFVPFFKTLTGLPPFMGILLALGALWLLTDLIHHPYEDRKHLRLPTILTRIDTSGVLFFLGILLSVGALESVGFLEELSHWIGNYTKDIALISTLIGLLSAVVDNVPLVAASMGMYSLSTYPVDSQLWQMIAYCAGTGGSVLIIGSAAGVALMGLEKVDFIWYVKKISLIALVGYLAGVGAYLAQRAIIAVL